MSKIQQQKSLFKNQKPKFELVLSGSIEGGGLIARTEWVINEWSWLFNKTGWNIHKVGCENHKM